MKFKSEIRLVLKSNSDPCTETMCSSLDEHFVVVGEN